MFTFINKESNYLLIVNGFNMTKKNKELLRKDIGIYLKKARKDKCLTGNQFGRLLLISQQQISRYERGVTSINIETLDNMLDILEKNWLDFVFTVMIEHSDTIKSRDSSND